MLTHTHIHLPTLNTHTYTLKHTYICPHSIRTQTCTLKHTYICPHSIHTPSDPHAPSKCRHPQPPTLYTHNLRSPRTLQVQTPTPTFTLYAHPQIPTHPPSADTHTHLHSIHTPSDPQAPSKCSHPQPPTLYIHTLRSPCTLQVQTPTPTYTLYAQPQIPMHPPSADTHTHTHTHSHSTHTHTNTHSCSYAPSSCGSTAMGCVSVFVSFSTLVVADMPGCHRGQGPAVKHAFVCM